MTRRRVVPKGDPRRVVAKGDPRRAQGHRCEKCGNPMAAIIEDGVHDWFCLLGCDMPQQIFALDAKERDGELPGGTSDAYARAFEERAE